MLKLDSGIVVCSRFVNCDMNSTLGSVVPLAIFTSSLTAGVPDFLLLISILVFSPSIRVQAGEYFQGHGQDTGGCFSIWSSQFKRLLLAER